MLKRLLGAQWVAIGFVGAISFLLSVAIARRFGPEAFGVYAQAVSLGAFLVILIDGGFGKLLMRETVRESSALIGQGKDLHAFAFGHAFLVMAILALLVVLNPLSLHWPTLLAAVGAFGVAVLGQFSLAILRGRGRLMRDALWQMLGRLLTAICMALALYWGASAPWEVLGAQFLGGLLFVLILMRRGWIMPIFRVPRQIYATLVPLVWVDLATVVYFRSDMLLFKFADVAKADVGAYGVAFRLIEAFLLLASPVSLLLFRRFRQNEAVMGRQALLKVVRLAAIASGLGMVIFLVSWPVADVSFQAGFWGRICPGGRVVQGSLPDAGFRTGQRGSRAGGVCLGAGSVLRVDGDCRRVLQRCREPAADAGLWCLGCGVDDGGDRTGTGHGFARGLVRCVAHQAP